MVERGSAMADLPSRFAEGEQVLRQGIDEAEAVGDWVLVSRGLNNMVKYLPAEAPENAELVSRMREAAELGGFDLMRAYAALRAARHAIAIGDMADARSRIDEATEMLSPDGHKGVWIGHLLAFLLLEEGRLDAADALLEQLPSTGDRGDGHLAGRPAARPGRPPRRPSPARRARPDDRRDQHLLVPDGGARGPARRHRGGDPPRASPSTTSGSGSCRAGPRRATVRPSTTSSTRPCSRPTPGATTTPSWAWRRRFDRIADLHLPVFRQASLRLLLARSLVAIGRRDDALPRPAPHGRCWPAGPAGGATTPTRCSPRSRPRRPRTTPASAPASVRSRRLLAEGLSNAELARRLYISPKTAAVHVSNILAKLGMSSRAEVAAWAVRTGLAAEASPA